MRVYTIFIICLLAISNMFNHEDMFLQSQGSLIRKSYMLHEQGVCVDQDTLSREGLLRFTVNASMARILQLFFTDIYMYFIKGQIIKLYKFVGDCNIRRTIKPYLKSWWAVTFSKLKNNAKFSQYAEKKLKKCFYDAGVRAYKKTVLDVKETPSELFFLTLMEFKKHCIIGYYGTNSVMHERFKLIEKNLATLTALKNVYPIKSKKSVPKVTAPAGNTQSSNTTPKQIKASKNH